MATIGSNKVPKGTGADVTGLSEGIMYDDGSQVGIGTTSPTAKLDVKHNSDASGQVTAAVIRVRSNNDSSGRGTLVIGRCDTPSTHSMFLESNDTTTSGIAFRTRDGSGIDNRMVIAAGGNVGIGTTSPGAQLEIKSSSASTVPLNVNTPASPSVDIARFQQNGSTKLVISKDGHVGIGTDPGIAAQQVYGSFSSWMALFQNTDSSGHGIAISLASTSDTSEVLCVYSTIDKALLVTQDGKVHIGAKSGARLSVDGGIQIDDDTDSASGAKAGTLRYRTNASIGYLDVCVQTGMYSYSWVNIAHG